MDRLIDYFNAYSVWDLLLLWLNGVLATTIFLILLFTNSAATPLGRPLTLYERAVRFVLTAAYGVLTVRVWAGWYFTPVEPTHVAVNMLVLVFVATARGDVAAIVRALQQIRAARHGAQDPRKSS